MIWYILVGLFITFVFDLILKNTEQEFNTLDRLACISLWPLVLGWFIWFMIKTFSGRK